MSSEILEEMTELKMRRKILEEMTPDEIDQFLTCALAKDILSHLLSWN